MAPIAEPLPVKYFVAVLYRDPARLDLARVALKRSWGEIDCEGEDHPFDVTGYYDPEMGPNLLRRLLSFAPLRSPTELVAMKLDCNQLEDALAIDGKRTVNCDAGYLDHNKVVLASAKEAGQKVYLDKGIYADLAGRWKTGRYCPFEWSFPDFRDGRYDTELARMRTLCLRQLRQLRAESADPSA